MSFLTIYYAIYQKLSHNHCICTKNETHNIYINYICIFLMNLTPREWILLQHVMLTQDNTLGINSYFHELGVTFYHEFIHLIIASRHDKLTILREPQCVKISGCDYKYNKVPLDNVSKFTEYLTIKNYNDIPDTIEKLINLESLQIKYNGNYILNISNNISSLVNLKTLSIKCTHDTYPIKSLTLPSIFVYSSQLSALNISHCGLLYIPEIICNLEKLESLSCHTNQIKFLPKSLNKLINLRTLDLHKNLLTELSFDTMTNITSLNISSNKLELLNDNIIELKHLTELNIEYNYLRKLTNAFGKLHNLEKLIMNHNKITLLPENFHKLWNLQCLHMNGNSLQFISYKVFELPYLTDIELALNNLDCTDYPKYIRGNMRIRGINIQCPIILII